MILTYLFAIILLNITFIFIFLCKGLPESLSPTVPIIHGA